MLYSNNLYHRQFVRRELSRFLLPCQFATRVKRKIGNELDGVFSENDYEPEKCPIEFCIQSLADWIKEDGGLDPEWLAEEDGRYFDDDGDIVALTGKPCISGDEQLAAYGLWFLDVEFGALGTAETSDLNANRINSHGWSEALVNSHQSECLLLAYQALPYLHQRNPRPEESSINSGLLKFDFSAIGKAGAAKRHARMRELSEWAVARFREGKWNSANEAASLLADSIREHGRTIGAVLTEQNAQRTIAEWFRKSKKLSV